MKLEMLAIRDAKMQAFMTPWFSLNLAVAVRLFADAVNDPVSTMHKNPEDFALYHLGTFEDGKGSYDQFAQPIKLGSALDFQKGNSNVR